MTIKDKKQQPASFYVGEVVGFRGLKGEMKIKPAVNNSALLASMKHIQLEKTNFFPTQDLLINTLALEKGLLFVSFLEFPDRTAVEPLMGARFFTWDSELEELGTDEFWVKDLIGMDVFDHAGEIVGKIVDIIYGGNHIIEIRREQDPPDKTILIPFVKNIVPTVDTKNRRIVVANIPGLLEAQ